MPTALVTGPTSGIGLAFARALAAEGSDLVLVARDSGRLESVAQELRSRHPGLDVALLVADLSGDVGQQLVAQRLAAGVDLLVNNAGRTTSETFEAVPWAQERAVLDLNVLAVLRLCHAAIPPMLAAGHGDVINVSSVAGFFPTSGGGTYAASKAYVTALSESLAMTYVGTGVRVLALCPGFTRTEFHQRASLDTAGIPDRMWLEADAVVARALRDLRRGRFISVPGALYKVLVAGGRYVPAGLSRRATAVAKKRRRRP